MPDTYHRVTLVQLYHGQTIMNVVHVKNDNGLITAENIAANFLNFWIPPFRLTHNNQHKYVEIQVASIRNPNPASAFILPVNLTSTGGSSQSPSFACWKIRFGTGLAGRNRRGRYYIGGIEWSLHGGGGLLSTFGQTKLTDCTNVIRNNWLPGGSTKINGLTLVLDHKDDADTPTVITTAVHATTMGVQRRRNLLVGI